MKQVLFFFLYGLLILPVKAQVFNTRPTYWSVYVYGNTPGTDDYKGFPGKEVEIQLSYKDANGAVRYIENFTTTLNDLSFVKVSTGDGTIDPSSPEPDYFGPDYTTICYTLEVQTDTGPVVNAGEHEIGGAPYAVYTESAQTAENAIALGGIPWVGDNVNPDPTTSALENYALVMAQRDSFIGGSRFNQIPFSNMLKKETAPSAVNAEPVEYFETGTMFGSPFVHDPDNEPIPEIENFITHCFRPEEKFYNGIGFKFKNTGGPALSHSTAAVYAENIYDPLGVGLFTNGASRGSYNQGPNGMLGLTIGTGNGAASWSRVAVAPGAGGYKYGMYCEDQGFADAYAAAVHGKGYYTISWSQLSDASLKREIRTQSNGLEQVMKLRPAQYRYIENKTYGFTDGIHHGFIAQEMEDVLPELVSDINMPVSIDPENLTMEGAVTYKAINYIELIPILTSAIQELNTDLAEMKAMLDAQAVQIEQLHKALEASNKPK